MSVQALVSASVELQCLRLQDICVAAEHVCTPSPHQQCLLCLAGLNHAVLNAMDALSQYDDGLEALVRAGEFFLPESGY